LRPVTCAHQLFKQRDADIDGVFIRREEPARPQARFLLDHFRTRPRGRFCFIIAHVSRASAIDQPLPDIAIGHDRLRQDAGSRKH
jgi:hypothetical protein